MNTITLIGASIKGAKWKRSTILDLDTKDIYLPLVSSIDLFYATIDSPSLLNSNGHFYNKIEWFIDEYCHRAYAHNAKKELKEIYAALKERKKYILENWDKIITHPENIEFKINEE